MLPYVTKCPSQMWVRLWTLERISTWAQLITRVHDSRGPFPAVAHQRDCGVAGREPERWQCEKDSTHSCRLRRWERSWAKECGQPLLVRSHYSDWAGTAVFPTMAWSHFHHSALRPAWGGPFWALWNLACTCAVQPSTKDLQGTYMQTSGLSPSIASSSQRFYYENFSHPSNPEL